MNYFKKYLKIIFSIFNIMYSNILNNINQAIKINKNEIIEEVRAIYGDILANDILNNNDSLTEYYFNNILIS